MEIAENKRLKKLLPETPYSERLKSLKAISNDFLIAVNSFEFNNELVEDLPAMAEIKASIAYMSELITGLDNRCNDSIENRYGEYGED